MNYKGLSFIYFCVFKKMFLEYKPPPDYGYVQEHCDYQPVEECKMVVRTVSLHLYLFWLVGYVIQKRIFPILNTL